MASSTEQPAFWRMSSGPRVQSVQTSLLPSSCPARRTQDRRSGAPSLVLASRKVSPSCPSLQSRRRLREKVELWDVHSCRCG
ncbi:hypothetical protein C8T65DRAFT_618423 [Cerioporus squamosus]|nr:hypothetical protein C8T65DRAFT_618423 [Cerioporus squamosus]